jgi:hypothetical protein
MNPNPLKRKRLLKAFKRFLRTPEDEYELKGNSDEDKDDSEESDDYQGNLKIRIPIIQKIRRQEENLALRDYFLLGKF